MMSVYDLFDIRGRTALVTGASRGIDRVIAHSLAEAGGKVALLGTNQANLEAVAGELEARGGKALVLPTDVSRGDEVDASFLKIEAAFGRLDICVNNAGISRQSPAEDLAETDWESIMEINLKGVFLCC